MKKRFFLPMLLAAGLMGGCKKDDAAGAGDSHTLEPLVYTIYSAKSELFMEFKPLVVGQESRFAAHLTHLGEAFKPFMAGSVRLSLSIGGQPISAEAAQPASPGIFRLALTPTVAGVGDLELDVQAPSYKDKFRIRALKVYASEAEALADHGHSHAHGNTISYLKEQAWKTEFANAPVQRQPFSDVIKTSGEFLSAPGDEAVVTAKAAGIVRFLGQDRLIVGAEVGAGAGLFSVEGGGLATGNLDASIREAQANLDKAKADLDRATELVKDKIISEREYQDLKWRHEVAEIALKTLRQGYNGSAQVVAAPISGFVKSLLVTEGQLVEPGTPLATLSRNKKVLLQASVSQRYFHLLSAIRSANIHLGDGRVLSTDSLHAQVSVGRSISGAAPFLPITFEIDNTWGIVPGSVVEVYLKTLPIPDALVIPASALMEEQGIHYAYVQVGGETFEKRELRLGANDGLHVQVLSGLAENERVVTKGAYQIKLAAASGTMPAHGHEH